MVESGRLLAGSDARRGPALSDKGGGGAALLERGVNSSLGGAPRCWIRAGRSSMAREVRESVAAKPHAITLPLSPSHAPWSSEARPPC